MLLTVLSRIGAELRVVLTHDVAQRDNLRVGRHDGVVAVVEALKGHPLFAHVTLTRSERSPIAALVTEMLEDLPALTRLPGRTVPGGRSHCVTGVRLAVHAVAVRQCRHVTSVPRVGFRRGSSQVDGRPRVASSLPRDRGDLRTGRPPRPREPPRIAPVATAGTSPCPRRGRRPTPHRPLRADRDVRPRRRRPWSVAEPVGEPGVGCARAARRAAARPSGRLARTPTAARSASERRQPAASGRARAARAPARRRAPTRRGGRARPTTARERRRQHRSRRQRLTRANRGRAMVAARSAGQPTSSPACDSLWTRESGWTRRRPEPVLRRLRHPAGAARLQDGLGRR